MRRLDNPKHEAFALGLAKGLKQIEAYVQAGYSPNPSASSRLAQSPEILDRVDALKLEINDKINTAMTNPSGENFESLAEMGLDMNWVALQYKTIYSQALDANSFAAANAAVQNIQKLIEIQGSGGNGAEEERAPTIKINDVKDMLLVVKDIVELGQKEGSKETPEPTDITPATVAAIQALSDGDDHDR